MNKNKEFELIINQLRSDLIDLVEKKKYRMNPSSTSWVRTIDEIKQEIFELIEDYKKIWNRTTDK